MSTSATGMLPTCPHCGNIHIATCPRIKAIEYNPDGTTKRIEFHEPPPLVARQGASS